MKIAINYSKARRNGLNTTGLQSQKGIATILLVIMLAIAITATSLSMMHSVRSTQEKHEATHASTHAQSGVWAAAEAFRTFLGGLTQAQLEQLPVMPASIPISVTGGTASTLSATVVVNQDIALGLYLVEANILNQHISARASSALSVMYQVIPGAGPTPPPAVASLDFYDDLDATGGIQIIAPSGTLPDINVDGNVHFDQLNITSLGELRSTGTVHLGSGVDADLIYANEDVFIKDTVQVDKIYTLGSFEAQGSANSPLVWANGDALINSSGRFDNINTVGNIDVTMGAHGLLKAGGYVTVGPAAGDIDNIQAVGDVSLNAWEKATKVNSNGDLTACPGDTWTEYGNISVDGTVDTSCPSVPEIVEGGSNSITPMIPLTPFTMNPLIIDTWTLKDQANFVFEYDTLAARPKVTVYNINGAVNGTEYHIGNYTTGSHYDFLCTAFDANGKCSAPATPELSVCLGHSPQNGCVNYNTTTQTWTFNGTGTAPGIMWFEGNVHLSTGFNYATVLATGNVSSSGAFRGVSVNYGGYDSICLALAPEIAADSDATFAAKQATYTARYSTQYPTNLCDIVNTTYTPIQTGNISIAAGGFDPNGNGSFSGGNISLGALSEVWGAVLAGNILTTAGESNIYGYITAAVQGGKGVSNNSLGGATLVNMDTATTTYTPTDVPGMSGGGNSTPGNNGAGGAGASTILWTKYL